MQGNTLDIETIMSNYVDDLNQAISTRAFAPFAQKWFPPDAQLSFRHECEGIDNAATIWTHLFPKGPDAPRAVYQDIIEIVDGRVHAFRQLEGTHLPKPLYGFQETQFDDRTLISEIIIRSVQDKPELQFDSDAPKTRLGRIFMAFVDVFNEFFRTGDKSLLIEWCSPDLRMVIDSEFTGMGVIIPHNRIDKNTQFTLRGVEAAGDGRVQARVDFTAWGGLAASNPWDVVLTPEGQIRELHIALEM